MAILTTSQLEEHVTTALGDAALQRLLDDAEEAIIEAIGPAIEEYVLNDLTETFSPGGDRLMLSRRAASVVTVVEQAQRADPTTLAADDYELSQSGYLLRRLQGGTNSATRWHGEVKVMYVPYADSGSRARAQIELVKLEIAFTPGLASQTIGSWSEAYATSGRTYLEQRADILASLHPDPIVAF